MMPRLNVSIEYPLEEYRREDGVSQYIHPCHLHSSSDSCRHSSGQTSPIHRIRDQSDEMV
jgi:hypothetical protein